jgi:serine/threonine protein kinase
MYCPKCKETFEEGSRRFCPTDGSRLVPDLSDPNSEQWEGGIFSKILSKNKSAGDLKEALPNIPRFMVTESSSENRSNPTPVSEDDATADFFVLEDIEPDATQRNSFAAGSSAHFEEKAVARKINPFEIPAGHFELGGENRLVVSSAEFQADDPQSFVGRTVKGRYLITRFLGGEDVSFAFLADDKIVDDKKALVRILLPGDDEVMGSILDEELVSLAHIGHPNIARLVDSGQFTDGIRYLISEYIDALSAGDVLNIHGTIEPMRTARIIRQMASALNEIHQEGILHRDLRPSNIIIEPGDGDADHATLVNIGASEGEPLESNRLYKAPEILEGRVSTIASDIFSLAVVAFEMLTGELPFQGKTPEELLRSQYAGLDQLPSQVRSELPAGVDVVFEKALASEIADRYVKARDFGDALYSALAESPLSGPISRIIKRSVQRGGERVAQVRSINPLASPIEAATPIPSETVGRDLRLETPAAPTHFEEVPRKKLAVIIVTSFLLALLAFGWYYIADILHLRSGTQGIGNSSVTGSVPTSSPWAQYADIPPAPRTIAQPPNTNYYQNQKENLKGDLLTNFIGFSVYYPKDWKVNGTAESSDVKVRGKFLDISRTSRDGRLKEQMLISYYPSKGTYIDDADKFHEMVAETNETLKKILPNYQMVSEGEIRFNGNWRAYEVKFQGGGASESGGRLMVWGRRLFIPVERAGIRDGFEITMVATSASEEVRGVDDVGIRGQLAAILNSFEPAQIP